MSIFRPLINGKMRPALLLSMLALVVLSWVLLQTPHRNPEAVTTPALATDESGRTAEQDLNRKQRKDYLAAQHKEYTLGSRSGGDTCEYNLIHLGAALESYRADYTTYPRNLNELVPDYIDHLPNCPSAGKQTYAAAYTVTPHGYHCELACTDKHSGSYATKPPHYDSTKGMIYPDAERYMP